MKPEYWFDGFGNEWLTDLVEAPLPSWMQLSLVSWTPGLIWIVIGLLGAGVFMFWHIYEQWRGRAYQRAALQNIGEIEYRLNTEVLTKRQRQALLAGLNPILKRCFFSFKPRSESARLTGAAWAHFVRSHIPYVDQNALKQIEGLSYQRDVELSQAEALALCRRIAVWIRSLPPNFPNTFSDEEKGPS